MRLVKEVLGRTVMVTLMVVFLTPHMLLRIVSGIILFLFAATAFLVFEPWWQHRSTFQRDLIAYWDAVNRQLH